MSYIRSLSNPEGLYVWSCDEATHVWFTENGDYNRDMVIPQKTFDHILKRYNKGHTEIKFRGARLREVLDNEGQKIVLSYKGREVHMWLVTWDYIARRR